MVLGKSSQGPYRQGVPKTTSKNRHLTLAICDPATTGSKRNKENKPSVESDGAEEQQKPNQAHRKEHGGQGKDI
jgi:hypothetical protein